MHIHIHTFSGYKIVLHYVEGHYSLDARTNEEGPALVALQFVQAVQQGHLDLAKGCSRSWRAYQKANGLKLDCWPTAAVLSHMQGRK